MSRPATSPARFSTESTSTAPPSGPTTIASTSGCAAISRFRCLTHLVRRRFERGVPDDRLEPALSAVLAEGARQRGRPVGVVRGDDQCRVFETSDVEMRQKLGHRRAMVGVDDPVGLRPLEHVLRRDDGRRIPRAVARSTGSPLRGSAMMMPSARKLARALLPLWARHDRDVVVGVRRRADNAECERHVISRPRWIPLGGRARAHRWRNAGGAGRPCSARIRAPPRRSEQFR